MLSAVYKSYVIFNASSAAAVAEKSNLRGLSKADRRAGKEKFCHRYTIEDIETGEDKLVVANCEIQTANRTH
jgi:hypothetical protein